MKSKLSAYEGADASREELPLGGQAAHAPQPQHVPATDPSSAALETSKEYRAKYNLEDTIDAMPTAAQAAEEAARAVENTASGGFGGFVASFFLTDSELGKR